MHPLLLRCVAGGVGGLAAGPGAVPVADEPHGGQENLETSPSGMIIIDDMEENEKYSAKEAEEPSSRAGQDKVEIQTSDHASSSSDRCCNSPRFLPTPLACPYLLLFTYLRRSPALSCSYSTFISCPYGIPRRSHEDSPSLSAADGIVTVAVRAASTGSAPSPGHIDDETPEIIVDSSTLRCDCVSAASSG